ncbi:hypothetical protein, variant 3 [Aphanomyces invadans]|uniref:CSC1/OSCA1-like 7TM region domain-containing protein n=1 Tax=Aphanomyces invadans TaxID=157072 RepID=A0A024TLG4_9STRA|nr:hypothetical protein, variant 3 [Aphanomyces invadans]ETV94202.1 hypothetical protein, variant 3 [Aphanomyces invadans]|eukprot:XP_008876962.1 hypothetical protein, variant 3 [Aphanomyces invadans]
MPWPRSRRLWVVLWAGIAFVAAANVETVQINVPSGSAYGVLNEAIHSIISANATVPREVLVGLRVVGDKNVPDVRPNPVVLLPGTSAANFSIVGRSPGRFLIEWELLSMSTSLTLFNESSVSFTLSSSGAFVVFVINNQWPTVFYQVGLSAFVLVLGLAFFAWRRMSKSSIPFWGAHVEGLFQQVPFRTEEMAFPHGHDQVDPLDAPSLRDRILLFWRLPIADKLVVDRCGVETALCLHFLRDAGHLFTGLSIFSTVILVPINYVSGGALTKSYQEATISNVPLNSHWFWGHVAVCYIATVAMLVFVYRQYVLLSKLRLQDSTLVGPRSVFIQAGLPHYITSRMLHMHLAHHYTPHDVDTVRVVDDLSQVYQILGRRMALRNEASRLVHIYGTNSPLPWFLQWCPGTSCMPSVLDMAYDYAACLPCKRTLKHRDTPVNNDKQAALVDMEHEIDQALRGGVHSGDFESLDTAVPPPRIQRRLEQIHQELETYPHFQQRKGTGAAFIVFRSTRAKLAFLEQFLATQTATTKLKAQVDASFFRVRDTMRQRRQRSPSDYLVDSSHPSPLLTYLPNLLLQPAPEPGDIRWANLISRPRSLRRAMVLVFYQGITMTILLLFSTPASVLLYINLDPSSPLYTKLLEDNSIVTGFLRTYVPTLLLVSVNALLLVALFYLSIFEPWLTETKRMRSLLVKSFVYLVLSSILFPSIGVTAVYATTTSSKGNPLNLDQSTHASYVNSFLFNVCSNFFILYLAQLTCLGTVVQVLRTGERVLYQPWLRGRAITPTELFEACRPAPFYFGVEYALMLSAFLVTLLGTTLSPALVPCGAIYFYTRVVSTKYNALYVHPKAPGRGHVTRSVLSLVLVSALLFQIAMALILSQLGRREQWVAVVVLVSVTLLILLWWHGTVRFALEGADDDQCNQDAAAPQHVRRMSSSCLNALLQAGSHDEFMRGVPTPPGYQNPYDAGLKMFAALYRVQLNAHDALDQSWKRWKSTIKAEDAPMH